MISQITYQSSDDGYEVIWNGQRWGAVEHKGGAWHCVRNQDGYCRSAQRAEKHRSQDQAARALIGSQL